MEGCCSAHTVRRAAQAHGHQVWLMLPEYVRPYAKAQKNDDRDPEANRRGVNMPNGALATGAGGDWLSAAQAGRRVKGSVADADKCRRFCSDASSLPAPSRIQSRIG